MKKNLELPVARKRVQAVERALLILKCFDNPGDSLTLASLAQRSELYKSTILRLITSLDVMGFIRRTPDAGYILGPELRRLGGLALSQPRSQLEDLIRPALHRLVNVTKETASLYVLEGTHRVCLFRENSARPARHHLEEGTKHSLDRGAAGKIIHSHRAHGRDKLAKAVRQLGWAISKGERDPDLSAIAVPLLDGKGRLVGSLTVSGLTARFTPAKFERARRALLRESRMLRPLLPLQTRAGKS